MDNTRTIKDLHPEEYAEIKNLYDFAISLMDDPEFVRMDPPR